jgi:hypothetical protein
MVILGVALALAGWGGRNYAALGEFQPGSSHDGITIFETNYATARPSLLRTGTVDRYELETLAPHFAAVATMSEFDANRYFTREAIRYARSHPGDVIATAALKSAMTLTGVNPARPLLTSRNLVAAATSLTLLVAGVLGWRLLETDAGRPDAGLVAFLGIVVTMVTCAGMLAGPAGLRYRLSVTPFLYLGAAAVIVRGMPSAFCLMPSAFFSPPHTASPRAGDTARPAPPRRSGPELPPR